MVATGMYADRDVVEEQMEMQERETGSDEHLIARARAEAFRRGTTLEAELRAWLMDYAGSLAAPDDADDRGVTPAPGAMRRPHETTVPETPAVAPSMRGAEQAPPERHPPPPPSVGDRHGSRELAYRRLSASIRDIRKATNMSGDDA